MLMLMDKLIFTKVIKCFQNSDENGFFLWIMTLSREYNLESK